MIKTNENSMQYEHSLDHCVEFFSKAGSLYDNHSTSFYENKEDVLDLFINSWIHNKEITFKLLLWLRSIRGGAGNRSGFRKCLKWLGDNEPVWVRNNIELIPEYGRWDDLRSLFNTACEAEAVDVWFTAIYNGNILAAKWAKRTDIPLYLRFKQGNSSNMGDFRRFLANIRKKHIVEHKMCTKKWNEIDYSTVPSQAMSRYTNAFYKHDEQGFEKYKESLKNNETKINASALFPHDCVRTVHYGDSKIADAQFDALPNYINDNDSIMVLCDSSGSMGISIGGNITAYDVSTSLSLYCSGKMPKSSPFYKKFIQFESESKFSDWNGMTFSEALYDDNIFDGAIGATRIDKALDLLLSTATMFNVSDKNIPKMLLICSDMQFTEAVDDYNKTEKQETIIERSLKKWDDKDYTRPKIVYWNLVPYDGQPDTIKSKNIALVSGFSPSILKSVLSCDDFSPKAVMMKALKDYTITIP